jgi:hypothetical protein
MIGNDNCNVSKMQAADMSMGKLRARRTLKRRELSPCPDAIERYVIMIQ